MITLIYIMLVVSFMFVSGVLLSHLETRKRKREIRARLQKMTGRK